MDFKVAGTRNVSRIPDGYQDPGITLDIMEKALEQAKADDSTFLM